MSALRAVLLTACLFVLLGAVGAWAQEGTATGAAAAGTAEANAEAAAPAPEAAAPAAEEEEFLVEEEVVPEKLSDAQAAEAVAAKVAEDSLLGIPEYQVIPLLGILSWLLMAVAVVTRLIKSRKHALKLFKTHKYAAWAAFAVATIHGLLVIF